MDEENRSGERLAGVVLRAFESVLGTSGIPGDTTFAVLGGDSVAAVRVVARLRRELGIEIPLDAVFHHPSVTQLAAFLRANMAVGDARTVPPPAAPGVTEAPLASCHFARVAGPQRWPLTASNAWLACDLGEPVDVGRLTTALDALTRRHDALRTGFEFSGGQLRSVLHARAGIRPAVITSLASAAENDVDDFIRARVATPFDRRKPPLFDAVLIARDGRDVLVVIADHNICDGWAMDRLVRELDQLYRDGCGALGPALQMSQWTACQREFLRKRGAASVEYWSGRLAGGRAASLAGLDGQPGGKEIRATEFVVPARHRTGLARVAAGQGLTLYSLLAGHFLHLIESRTRSPELSFATHSLNRDMPGALEMIASCSSELWITAGTAVGRDPVAAGAAVQRELSAVLRHRLLGPTELRGGSVWPAVLDACEPALYFVLHDNSRPALFGPACAPRLLTQVPAGGHAMAVVATDTGDAVKVEFTWRADLASQDSGLALARDYEAALRGAAGG